MMDRLYSGMTAFTTSAHALRPIHLMGTLLFGPLQQPGSSWPRSAEIAAAARYPILLPRSGLNRLAFAAVIDLYPRQGTVSVEVIGHGKVLASAILPASQIRADAPVIFDFPPLTNNGGEQVELRLFARDLDVPLRIYEWHHYPYFGLGNPKIKPFCSFDFYSPQ